MTGMVIITARDGLPKEDVYCEIRPMSFRTTDVKGGYHG
jgi:hypothetical protein